MSSADIIEHVQGQNAAGDGDEDTLKNQLGNDDGDEVDHLFPDKGKEEEERVSDDEQLGPSPEQEEEAIKKKYGELMPKKPLISKDHERAFFDSADWALGKQGAQRPKGPLEALRPKLQPTPHHQIRSRRSAYTHAEDYTGDAGSDHASPEDANCMSDDGNDGNNAPKDHSSSGKPSM